MKEKFKIGGGYNNLKYRKGFTLIELLAVIVVLAIIALIAVPMILGVVERARKSAAESSALGYIDAVEKQMAINLVNETSIPDGEVTTTDLKTTYKVKVKGEEPKSGWVKIEKGKVIDYSLEIGKYVVDLDNGSAKATKNGTVRASSGGSIDTETETEQAPTYTAYSIGDSITLKDASNNETQWYVLEASDASTETVRLISKWNINPSANSTTTATDLFRTQSQGGYTIAFDTNNSNVYANSSIKGKLEGDFKAAIENALGITVNSIGIWDYNDMNNLGCTMTWSDSSSPAGVTRGTGATCSSSSYLDSMIKGTYSWINAPVAGYSNRVWDVHESGALDSNYYGATDSDISGVRPVITISKSQINN